MIELKDNHLVFRFPEVHEDAVCRVNFQRTLRIPDDNSAYPLPPGLGNFHLEHVEDHADNVSQTVANRGGVMLPMYQSEAMWLNFPKRLGGYPFALKIAAGKINAITGEPWSETLSSETQDYVVLPDQPWLDGFCVDEGLVRQFVAMQLGDGYTAEEQITGASDFGGLQIIAFPMKGSYYEELQRQRSAEIEELQMFYSRASIPAECESLGFAPGGLMQQEIYDDDYGIDAWDTDNTSRCFIHVLNSQQWNQATGHSLPRKPPTAKDYSKAGLPWFEYYDDKKKAAKGSPILAQLDSLAAKVFKNGKGPLNDNKPIVEPKVIDLSNQKPGIKDGHW